MLILKHKRIYTSIQTRWMLVFCEFRKSSSKYFQYRFEKLFSKSIWYKSNRKCNKQMNILGNEWTHSITKCRKLLNKMYLFVLRIIFNQIYPGLVHIIWNERSGRKWDEINEMLNLYRHCSDYEEKSLEWLKKIDSIKIVFHHLNRWTESKQNIEYGSQLFLTQHNTSAVAYT